MSTQTPEELFDAIVSNFDEQNAKTATEFKDHILLFKKEVCDRSEEIDEDQEQDWFSLSLGWAIAKGIPPEEAHHFAVCVRYDFHYFN